MDEVHAFPVSGHGPGDALLRLGDGIPDHVPDPAQHGLYRLILSLDVFLHRLRLSAVVGLLPPGKLPAAFRTLPHGRYQEEPFSTSPFQLWMPPMFCALV